MASSTAFSCFRSSSRRVAAGFRTGGGGVGDFGEAGLFLAPSMKGPWSPLFSPVSSSFFGKANGSVFLMRVSLIWGLGLKPCGPSRASRACSWSRFSSKPHRSKVGSRGSWRPGMTTGGANSVAGGGGGAVTLGPPFCRKSFSTRFLEPSGIFLAGDGFLAWTRCVLAADAGAGTRWWTGELEADEMVVRLGLRERLCECDLDGVRDELDLVTRRRDMRRGLGVVMGDGEGLYDFRRCSAGDLPTAGPPVKRPLPACLARTWLG